MSRRESKTYMREAARTRRKLSIRKRLSGTADRPRLTVFRSLKHIYAQIIDDETGKTLVAYSSKSKDFNPDKLKKMETSFQVGLKLGEKALAAGITQVAFDRNGYLYHGRVKALKEGAVKAGLSL